ncbi:MAG TPA: polysaccharide biosynthesis protein [Capillimicrobium sp.]|nr:polysaccharide biosynthesis protein [Capillimicrobium sp.]
MTAVDGRSPASALRRASRARLVAELRAASTTGAGVALDPAGHARLQAITRELRGRYGTRAAAELARFRATASREIDVDLSAVARRVAGATVLVTGGTGCIGSELLRRLGELAPARLASMSRGRTTPAVRLEGVEHLAGDVGRREDVERGLGALRPDVVFHLAAQRDPAAAERWPVATARTNAVGTAHVVDACAAAGVRVLVYASTGKAMRPFTGDSYAASKKVGEWLVARADPRLACAAARFTHVVDNSLFVRRLLRWLRAGEPVCLHDPEIAFSVQSARESAQMLLVACAQAVPEELHVCALRDLGAPVELLDLGLGGIEATGSASVLRVVGFEAGYEPRAFPAMFDPVTALDASPLFNALEAPDGVPVAASPDVDAFALRFCADDRAGRAFAALAAACAAGGRARVRRARDALGWTLLDARLPATDVEARRRALRTLRAHDGRLSPDDRRIAAAIASSLAAGEQATAA